MEFIIKSIHGIIALIVTIRLTAKKNIIQNQLNLAESQLSEVITRLGKNFYEKNSDTEEVKKFNIPFLVKEEQEALSELEQLIKITDEEKKVFKEKEKALEDLININKSVKDEKLKLLNSARNNLKTEQKKVVLIQKSLDQNKERKNRVREFKTFIPAHFLEQKEKILMSQLNEAEAGLQKIRAYIIPIEKDCKDATDKLNNFTKELNSLKKEFKSGIDSENKKEKQLVMRAGDIKKETFSAYLKLGEYLEQNKLRQSDLLSIHEKISSLRNQLYEKNYLMKACISEIEKYAPQKKYGAYLILFIFFILCLSGIIFLRKSSF